MGGLRQVHITECQEIAWRAAGLVGEDAWLRQNGSQNKKAKTEFKVPPPRPPRVVPDEASDDGAVSHVCDPPSPRVGYVKYLQDLP